LGLFTRSLSGGTISSGAKVGHRQQATVQFGEKKGTGTFFTRFPSWIGPAGAKSIHSKPHRGLSDPVIFTISPAARNGLSDPTRVAWVYDGMAHPACGLSSSSWHQKD
jgi:hypothetical protein